MYTDTQCSIIGKNLCGGGVQSGIISRRQYVHIHNDIISLDNLLSAWQEFIKGKRNRKDTQEFQYRLFDNIFALHTDLKNNTYQHDGYEAFNISDPKPRNIHKAKVRDRLLHHAIYRKLYPFFNKTFISDSYSCRYGEGTHKAMDRFRAFAYTVSKNHTKTVWVLKCDIKKFFASIDHEILKKVLAQHIEDKDLLRLLGHIVSSFSTKDKLGVGLPLGNLTSQLLVNIYMNKFDQFVKRRLKTKYYIRYADDFVFLHQDKKYLESLIPQISEFLSAHLRLTLHPDKLFIKTLASGVDFLGWVHFPDNRVLRTTTKKRMFRNIKAKDGKEETVQSYLGLISHGNSWKLRQKILGKASNPESSYGNGAFPFAPFPCEGFAQCIDCNP